MPNPVTVEITLNSMGYKGDEIKILFDDTFPVYYPTKVTYTFLPAAVPPLTANICVIFGIAASCVAGGFLSEFGKDIYNWVKKCVVKALTNDDHKRTLVEFYLIFEDMDVFIDDNDIEKITSRFQEIIELIQMDKKENALIELKFNPDTDKFEVVSVLTNKKRLRSFDN